MQGAAVDRMPWLFMCIGAELSSELEGSCVCVRRCEDCLQNSGFAELEDVKRDGKRKAGVPNDEAEETRWIVSRRMEAQRVSSTSSEQSLAEGIFADIR